MATRWAIPPLWEGMSVAILAPGPSLSRAVVAGALARCQRSIAVSDAHRLAPQADLLWSCDAKWWLFHSQQALGFQGLKVTLDDSVPFSAVLQVQNGGRLGFDERPTHIRNGGNSGYQAVHVAAHLGAKKVELYGFDMRVVDGRRHFFGDHPAPLHMSSPYTDFIRDFETLAPELAARGIEVVNFTPGSALRCFPFASPEIA